VLFPALGIDRTSSRHTNKNKDTDTQQAFPLKRINLYCGNCKQEERDRPIYHPGCCGLHIQAKLVTNDAADKPHLIIQKFRLPTTSKHALINGSTKKKIRETEPHVHENQLTEEQTRVLKSLGKRRVSSYYVKAIMKDLFSDLNMTDDLMWRVHGKGREEAYGSDDQTMALFIEGNEWRKNGGSFQTQTCDLALHSWSGQMELELLLANLYGRDSYYVDTTFGAGNWGHKLGLQY
jgi:hypothetical protein